MRAVVPALLASAMAVMLSVHWNRALRRELAAADRAAATDALTGIANRTGLHWEFEQLMVAMKPDERIGIMLLDLDGFKSINDRYGHDAGDEVLRRIADRLATGLQASYNAFAARLGGDEFALLARLDDHGDWFAHAATEMAGLCRKPIAVDGAALRVGVSIGVTHQRAEQASRTELLAEADAAMYRAKRARTGVRIYDRATDGPADRAPRPSRRTRHRRTPTGPVSSLHDSALCREANQDVDRSPSTHALRPSNRSSEGSCECHSR